MTTLKLFAFLAIVWASSVRAQVHTAKRFRVTGQVMSAYTGNFIPYSTIMYGGISGTRSDSLGKFEIKNLQTGHYILTFSALCYPAFDTTIFIADTNVDNFKLVVQTVCSILSRDSALKDIKANHLKLFLQSGDPPIAYTTDRKFSKKFKVEFYDFADLSVYPCDCIAEYNRAIFEFLDSKYGNKWRSNFRPGVLGYK